MCSKMEKDKFQSLLPRLDTSQEKEQIRLLLFAITKTWNTHAAFTLTENWNFKDPSNETCMSTV